MYDVVMTSDKTLLALYVPRMQPLLELAKKAYGSRDTVSPQHDASREYTRLLCLFYEEGGSLLDLANTLGVTYAGLKRRINTASVPPSSHRPRKKFGIEVYEAAVKDINAAKAIDSHTYHVALKKYYDEGLSMARIATHMNLSSANPLYYGITKIRLEEDTEEK